jgi:guanyl-specific ribonuclease Sa
VRRTRRPLLALIVLLLVLAVGYVIKAADTGTTSSPTIRTVHLSALPPQAAQVVRLIGNGGPFPYEQDGVVFHNDEHRLPREPDGYYHEYTVPTPGSPDRGARRIITGAAGQYYYTADHYETFERVDIHR